MKRESFFAHPSFTDIYSFTLHLVNHLYDGVKAATLQEKDRLVTQAIAEVQRAYTAGEPPDVKEWATKCAYVYSFVPSHISMVRYFLKAAVKQGWVPELVHAVKASTRLGLVALGGGPGGDVLGFLQWASDLAFWGSRLDVLVLDPPGSDWFKHQQEIRKQMGKTDLGFTQTSLTYNFRTATPSSIVSEKIASADLVTMVKGMSSVCVDGSAREGVWKLLKLMKPGAMLLVIDDSVNGQTFFDALCDRCGLQCVGSMAFNECNTADFFQPEDKERLGFCFESVASRVGGWPVQEAFISGSVFKRVSGPLVSGMVSPACAGNGVKTDAECGPTGMVDSAKHLREQFSRSTSWMGSPDELSGSRTQLEAVDSFRYSGENGGMGQLESCGLDNSIDGKLFNVDSFHGGSSGLTTSVNALKIARAQNGTSRQQEEVGISHNMLESGMATVGLHQVTQRNGDVHRLEEQQSTVFFPVVPIMAGEMEQQVNRPINDAEDASGVRQWTTRVVDLNDQRVVDLNKQVSQTGTSGQTGQSTCVVDLNNQRIVAPDPQNRQGGSGTQVVDLNYHRVVDLNTQNQHKRDTAQIVDLNQQRVVGLGGQQRDGSKCAPSPWTGPRVLQTPQGPMTVVPRANKGVRPRGESGGQGNLGNQNGPATNFKGGGNKRPRFG